MIMRMKKRAICKSKYQEIIKSEDGLPTPKGLYECTLQNGRCYLSVDKMKQKGEFYRTYMFNAFVRRLWNMDVGKFNDMLYGYFYFRHHFNSRRSMVRALKKARRMGKTNGQ